MASIWLFGLSEYAMAGKSGVRDPAKRQQQAGIVRGGGGDKVWVGLRLREEAWPLHVVTMPHLDSRPGHPTGLLGSSPEVLQSPRTPPIISL